MSQDIPRDRWDRPIILDPATGKTSPFTRVSRLAKAPDDVGGLINWSAAQAVRGLVARRDLYETACISLDDGKAINQIAAKAKEAAATDAAANFGTVLHRWTELLDLKQATLDDVPPDYKDSLSLYVEEMTPFEVIETELFCVADEVKAAGTMDRLLRLPDGAVVVADVKTGKHANSYGAQSVAIQTATYAHGKRYNEATGERTDLHPDLDPDRGVLIHMPLPVFGTPPSVDLYLIDTALGWQGALMAARILRWRKVDVLTPWWLAGVEQKVS